MHLHFTQSLEPLYGAGLGYSALGLHQGMMKQGIASELVSTKGVDYSEEWSGVDQFERMGPQKLFYAPELAKWAKANCEAVRVYHGHGLYVYPNFLLGRYAREENKPLVYHPHGFFDPWILSRSKLKKRAVHWLFENANFRHVAFWRALSEKERGQIQTVVGKNSEIVVLPNGVHLPPDRSTEAIEELQSRYPGKRPNRVLFLSRIHPKKGIDLLLKAWAALPASVRQDWEIALFGPNEDGYQAEMESLARDLGLADTCTFYGSVSGEAKEAAFRSADLFVLPSRSEGFPMAVLEAASYGLPVVQTNECNFSDLTSHEGAWEARPDIDSLTVTLEQALQADENERRQRGQKGKALVQRDYQWSAIAQQMDAACKRFA